VLIEIAYGRPRRKRKASSQNVPKSDTEVEMKKFHRAERAKRSGVDDLSLFCLLNSERVGQVVRDRTAGPGYGDGVSPPGRPRVSLWGRRNYAGTATTTSTSDSRDEECGHE
jgi:hypothetical protein